MRLLIDMNLSPTWVAALVAQGHQAVHWSTVGKRTAPDHEILAWARENDYTVFTHDLDFGAILAATGAQVPSVVQIRSEDPIPNRLGNLIGEVLRAHAAEIASGALISVDEYRARTRVLPLRSRLS